MQFYDAKRPAEYEKRPDTMHGWAPGPRGRSNKSRFVKTLIKYVKLYCEHTKLVGFKFFVEPGRTWFDRTLWCLLYGVTIPVIVFTIYHAYLQFIDSPFLTSVDADYFPTYKLNFPGVSICSINRISRQAAVEMANELSQVNISRLSFDEILEMISQLGDLYDSEFITHNQTYHIDQLLSEFYNEHYDITAVLKRLTPQCSLMLAKCRFHGEARNCSDIFKIRKTQNGFCCTFNYATKGDDISVRSGIDHRLEPLKVKDLGEDGGLSVLLEPLLDDFFYSIAPMTGWKVMISNPHDYPDMTSGGVTEILLSPGTQVDAKIDAIRFYSTPDIKPYREKRYCVFSEEMTKLRASYTYSDCIVDCKIEDMWQSCKCVPFYLPNRESRRVCTTEDVPCLSEHKSKWFSVVPHGKIFVHDESMNWGLDCRNCYPECVDVKYVPRTFTSNLNSGSYISRIMRNVKIENQSVLMVYFSRSGTISLRQDVLYRWYELMSDASGICGIFVGFSLIAVVEFIYFVGLFLLELWRGPEIDRVKKRQPAMQTIYWGELYPHTRNKNMKNRQNRNIDKY